MKLFDLLMLLAYLAEAASSQRIVCYVNGWAQYRPLPATFLPGQLDPFLCTHIVYSSAQIDGRRLQPAVKEDLRRFKDVQRLKINNPKLKTLLSVGGWDIGSMPFSILVNDSSSIREFAETTTKFLREHGFDGLDVDWRFPTERGSQKQDGARLTLLLKDIRVSFERESAESGKTRLILSAVVGSSKSVVDHGYEILEVTELADFLNVLSVDLVGSWEVAAHPSPLQLVDQVTSSTAARRSLVKFKLQTSNRWTADYWLQKVRDPVVFNLGLSFHSLTFLLTSPKNDSLGAPAKGPGRVGTFTFTKGRLAFFEVCLLQALGARRTYLASYQVPYLVHRDMWVAYEDRDSLAAKVRFIRETGVGGVAVWYIDEDDFGGTFCHLGSYPLLKLVSRQLLTKQPSARIPGSITSEDTRETKEVKGRQNVSINTECGRVVCFVSSHGGLRTGQAAFLPSQVKADLCTHFIYAHARLDGTRLVPQYPQDTEMYKLMVQIRKRWNPKATVMLSVGGWDVSSAPFTRLVASAAAVKVFAQQAAIFLQDTGFDGLDIDWQFPTSRGSPLTDRDRFTNFLQEVRGAFNVMSRPGRQGSLLLSVTLSARQDILTTAYDLSALHQHVNFINFATFDQHGTWEEVKEHHSPLFSPSPPQVNGRALSASKATEIVKRSSIPMWKLNFGVPFYARSYTLANSSTHVSSGRAGNHTGQKGFLAYFEVCELLKKGATTGWISDQVVPFLTYGDQWVAFDNQRSINEKVQYAMKSGYGGLAVWTVDVDDFSGQFCQQGPFPLLQTLLSSCSRYS